MNILIPHSWLLEQLTTKASPEEIQKLVSLSGPSVERIYDREGEPVYDIEVTTNRADSMSVRGMAREVAVILAANGVAAKLKPLSLEKPTIEDKALPLPEINNNPEWCHRIMCVVLDQVQHIPTPKWMAKRLRQIDQNEHDSVIDITNYVTHEYGHPIHAFDYDKIMNLGGVIRVVEAKPGKAFTTLDGVEYLTKGGEIVFENDKGEIIDLPAIKGTANSAVDDSTKRVLLWVESLDAAKVRTASMKHAIRTVAAQLNEKHVDPNLAAITLFKAVALYQKLTQAKVASKVYDEFHPAVPSEPINVSFNKIEAYLGIKIPPKKVKDILIHLECEVILTTDGIQVIPPSFRPDIQISADVIEEIARMYGYHNLPSVLMTGAIPTSRPQGTNFNAELQTIRLLAALGAQEVYTYSLVSAEMALQSGFTLEEHLAVANPLLDDTVFLRRSLDPSLQAVLANNPTRENLTVFELASVYHPKKGTALPNEERHLTLVSREKYPKVRAMLDRLLRDFYITVESIDTTTDGKVKMSGKSTAGTTTGLGTIESTNGITTIDLLWSAVLDLASAYPRYQPIPKSAPLLEDLTFELPDKTPLGKVIATIAAASNKVAAVSLQDTYQNRFTFRVTFQDPIESLSTEAVAPIRAIIVTNVTKEHGGTLVGTLA